MEACGSPVFWIETSGSVSRQFQFESNGGLSMKVVDDSRTVVHRVVDLLLNKFFSFWVSIQCERGVFEIYEVPGSTTLFQCGIICAFYSVTAICCKLAAYSCSSNCCQLDFKGQHVGKLICSNFFFFMDFFCYFFLFSLFFYKLSVWFLRNFSNIIFFNPMFYADFEFF